MAIELTITATDLGALRAQVEALHAQLSGAAPVQKAYEIGSGEPIEEKPKASKAKAEKPKADTVAEYKAALDGQPSAPLDYAKDVVSKILAKVAELQSAGKAPADAKAAVQDVIRSTFGVTNAKEVPADKWPALLEAVAKVSANG